MCIVWICIYTAFHRSEYTPHIFANILLYLFISGVTVHTIPGSVRYDTVVSRSVLGVTHYK